MKLRFLFLLIITTHFPCLTQNYQSIKEPPIPVIIYHHYNDSLTKLYSNVMEYSRNVDSLSNQMASLQQQFNSSHSALTNQIGEYKNALTIAFLIIIASLLLIVFRFQKLYKKQRQLVEHLTNRLEKIETDIQQQSIHLSATSTQIRNKKVV